MNFLFRILLSLSATMWMVGIYAIKAHWIIHPLVPFWMIGIVLLLLSGRISFFCLGTVKSLHVEEINGCSEVHLQDVEALRPYFLYMVLAVVSPDNITFGVLYFIVFLLHYKTQSQYCNPWYILAGYHCYRLRTKHGTEIFVLAHGKVLRCADDVRINTLRRLNDSTFIGFQRKRGEGVDMDEAE